MPISFKFKFANETRRSIFPEPPPWDVLSARLQAVYGLPKDVLAVSYLDVENDEITVSTEDELQDYYRVYCRNLDQDVKLNVLDHSSRRTGATSTPRVPLAVFDLDDEWQRLPSFHAVPELVLRHPEPYADSIHAFVEVIDDEGNVVAKDFEDAGSTRSDASTVQAPLDKGKGKAPVPSRGTSTQSVLDEELPDKHEIHVLNRSASPNTLSIEPLPIETHDDAADVVHNSEDPTDPPIPDLGGLSPPPHPHVSLTEDIASLIGSFSNVVDTHPDLAINLHRIIDNARRGTYWESHRENLTRSVNEISASVGPITDEFRRNAEAEAARRISETLGGLFRSLSLGVDANAPAEAPVPASNGEGTDVPPTDPKNDTPMARAPWNIFTSSIGANFPHPPPPPPLPGTQFGSSTFNPPPLPPPLPHVVTDLVSAPLSATENPEGYPPAPPKGPSRFSGTSARRPSTGQAPDHNIWSPNTRPSWLPAPPPPIQDQPSQSSDDSPQKASSRELRASVEAAKALYKAEKERYRKEREERRRQREKDPKASGSGSEAIADVQPIIKNKVVAQERGQGAAVAQDIRRSTSTLVSNARGPYPRLEMVNISSRRHHTMNTGHGSSTDDANLRSYTRIMKKLGDMGFTESSHPDLPFRVKAKLSTSPAVPATKGEEDDIITIVMEELLVPVPVPSLDRPVDTGGPSDWH